MVQFYCGSGSPYAWRTWLALDRKRVPYHRKTVSFDAGGFEDSEIRRTQSAAILEYIDDRWPSGPALFTRDSRKRAIQRRMAREANQYLADLGQRRVSGEGPEDPPNDSRRELARWKDGATGDYLTGELSAVDLSVYPFVALFLRRHAGRRPDFVKDDVIGPRLSSWIDRMQTLPVVQRTGLPHLK